MRFTPEILSFIRGEQFSNALKIHYSERFPEQSRIELLLQLSRGKRVLHIGCADHLPLINQKMEQGKWLHALLRNVADECTGIDINAEAVEFMSDTLKIPDIYHVDITNGLPEKLRERKWDLVIMGEILEHIDNPVHFLQQLKTHLQQHASQLVITVPNSFNRLIMNDININTEDINSDHMYHFTPYTLARVVYKSGFATFELLFADRVALPFLQKISNRLKKIFGLKRSFTSNYFASLIAVTNF